MNSSDPSQSGEDFVGDSRGDPGTSGYNGEMPWARSGVAVGALLVALALIGGTVLLIAGSEGMW
jgi:hypothetical protein